jgi:hypothetical protein
MGNPLSKGYGLLRKLAYVLPGIGISGIVAFATGPIIDYVESLMKVNDAASLAKNNLQNFNDIMADASKKAGEQTADLKILYQAATDVNLSMKDRLGAVKALKQEFPDYFANLTNEAILTGKAADKYDELTASIIASSKAKAAKDKIDQIEAQIFAAETLKAKIINANVNQAARAKDYTLQSQTTGSSQTGGGASSTVTITRAEQLRKINKNLVDALKVPDDAIKNLQAQEDFITKFIGIKDLAKATEDENTGKTGGKTKKTNPFEISLKDLEDNYKKAQALLVSQYDANLTDAKKNTTAVNDLVLKAQQDFLEKKLALIKRYGKKEGDTDLEIAKVNKALIANQIAFNIDQINTLPKVQGAPVINFKKVTTEKIDPKPYYVLSDAIQKNIKDQERMKELLEQTTVVLNKTLGPAFDTLFTNILEGSGNAFKAFGDAIKQMLVQLGAAILKAALFSAILSVISGGSSTLAGAAGGGKSFMDIFGPAMKSITGFASGGSISGPGSTSSDSILARVSNGEYIMNASAVSKFGASFFDGLNSGRLPKFASGGPVGSNMIVASDNHVFIPEVTLKGQDLIIAFNRANQRASRNG